MLQTYRNLEIIIVDGGSTDKSMEICESFKNNNKDFVVNLVRQKQKGLADARNHAITEASGDFITFVDADDVIDPEYVELMYNEIKNNSVDLICCGVNITDYTGNTLYKCELNPFFINRVLKTTDAINAILIHSTPTSAWAKLARKSFYDNIQYPVNRYYEDIMVNLEMIKKADGVFVIGKYLYNYRKNPIGLVNSVLTDPEILRDKYSTFNKFMCGAEEYDINREYMDRYRSFILDYYVTDFYEYQTMAYRYEVICGKINYNRKLALYGAGQIGTEYVKLNKNHFSNYIFIDQNPEKRSLLSYPVITPEEYSRNYINDYKLIMTCRFVFSATKKLLKCGAINSTEQLMLYNGGNQIEKELAKALLICLDIYDKISNDEIKSRF